MSSLKVEVVKIDKIESHPNADRLEICLISGWQCVVQKNKLIVGQAVVYIPIDSLLPEKLETYLFPPDSKIKLDKHRVKTIKIRGAVSQGMVLSLDELQNGGFITEKVALGSDLALKLGVTKYEPPEDKSPQSNANRVKKKYKNPQFREYTEIENFKWHPELFQEGEEVVICEKIHGTSFRAGYVPFFASTWWKKIKQFFHLTPEYEFVYGSHHVQLQTKTKTKANIYMDAVVKYNLKTKLIDGEVVYGEIVGDKIQKGYNYGCKPGERKLVVFDVQVDGKYLNHYETERFCSVYGFEHVPVEYTGPYLGKDYVKNNFVDGPSTFCSDQKIREGVVIKPLIEQHCYIGRKILKFKSDIFLIKAEDNTH